MVGKTRAAVFILVIAAALAAGCTGNTGPTESTDTSLTETPSPTNTPASDAPNLPGKQTGPEEPLMTIMVDLGSDMETINDALWRDDYDTVASAAQNVADHPKVLASQRKTLQSALSQEDFQAFVAYDRAVHTHSTNLSVAAEAGDAEAAIEAYADLQRGCTGCHDDYRLDVRSALGKSSETLDTPTVDPVASNTSQPLRPIMVELGENMKAVGNGLWAGNMANVRQAARNVGHHPKIQQSDLATVKSILGEERFQSFVAYDMAVHEGALNLSAAAESGDPRTITEEYVELQSGCQNCHTAFRDEIRSAD